MPESTSPPVEGHAARRARFREYMRDFNPTAPVSQAIDAGLVVRDLNDSVHVKLASRADLEPGSQQLLVGGIGSGKSTELVLAQRWLQDQGNSLAFYIDITGVTDLSPLNTGALLASFAVELMRELFRNFVYKFPEKRRDFASYAKAIRRFAWGWWSVSNSDTSNERDDEMVKVPGKLNPAIPSMQRNFSLVDTPLKDILGFLQTEHREVVVLFDGLDRLVAPARFWEVVEEDFAALRELGVSVIAAAPISVLFGAGRTVCEHFDQVHHLAPKLGHPASQRSLSLVLKMRDRASLLGLRERGEICSASGNVLRDLISLARDSGVEAYVRGHINVELSDTETASRQLGLSYLRGLGPAQIQALIDLNRTSALDVNSDESIELLVTRRVLEYSPTDFRVHPALLPLLKTSESRIA